MALSFDSGALIERSYVLPQGLRVRLRMPRASDAAGIAALAYRQGVELGPLEAARLVRFDPRHRLVVVAGALIDGRETLVGVGALSLDGETIGSPDLLVTDSELAQGLDALLERALVGRAAAQRRGRAA